MLQTLTRNHHIAIEGMVIISPLQIKMLRDDNRSYKILVRQNIADEHKPWAIINTKQPIAPVKDPIITPAITKLM